MQSCHHFHCLGTLFAALGPSADAGKVQKFKNHKKCGSWDHPWGTILVQFLDFRRIVFLICFWDQVFRAVGRFGDQMHVQRSPEGSQNGEENDPGAI